MVIMQSNQVSTGYGKKKYRDRTWRPRNREIADSNKVITFGTSLLRYCI